MNVQAVVNFCARECELQRSGEMSVGWMFNAWLFAYDLSYSFGEKALPTVGDVLLIGTLVEPKQNHFGFRTCGVQVGYDVKPNWQTVPRQMENLIGAAGTLMPEAFFKEFEEVHPFVDGNGRTGQILFNWLNRTMDDPVWAPDFWNDPRRTPGSGA